MTEFQEHRVRLMECLPQGVFPDNKILVKSPVQPEEPLTSSDLAFTQEGYFFWLTGWSSPDCYIAMDLTTKRSTFIIGEFPISYTIWSGAIPTIGDIKAVTGADEVQFIPADKDLPSPLEGYQFVYNSAAPDLDDPLVQAFVVAGAITRMQKTPQEIEWLEKAAVETSEALVNTMKFIKPGMNEKLVEHKFIFEGAVQGCTELSFITIVGSGSNAAYLHYKANNCNIKDGDLVLIDCGLFHNHYSGDVTRTFPANGKFSEEQRHVYTLLLELQKNLIKAATPGATINELNMLMFKGIFDIALKLNLVKEGTEFSGDVARIFCPHGLTHHLGCNVHDLSLLPFTNGIIPYPAQQQRLLAPGMAITIEPGIYFNRAFILDAKQSGMLDSINYDLAFHYCDAVGGIRIEDDIVITEGEPRVLSTCPKDPDALEALMAGAH